MSYMCKFAARKRVAPFVFIGVFFIAWTVRLSIYKMSGLEIENPLLMRVEGDGWLVLIWIILPILWMSFVERRSIASSLRPTSGRSFPGACIVAAVMIALIVIGYRLTFRHWIGVPLDRSWGVYATLLPSIVLVGIAEEFVFRGVFLSGLLRADWAPWRAHLMTGVFFALSHWPGWLAGTGSMGLLSFLTASVRLLIFGLVMSGLVELEGGLVLAILVHSFNDLWVGMFFH